jgi:signal transduction histidine kinase
MTPDTPEPSAHEELIAIIDHQLRTPMTKLLCHAELLQNQGTHLTTAARNSVSAMVLATSQLDDALKWACYAFRELATSKQEDTAAETGLSIAR